ncbi:MAG: 5-(carboxyamino)imidazole ribonucleotide mutase [Methanomassiliicoccus sp.]|jgi:5-(carboxyamino)imidazole ribonucleotide mutase|nr:5-(carboxyamino)imidazole ribonucleotide mutase [Methanomassiliicoccus sp.]
MPQVLIILGSKSDAPVAKKATDVLREFGVSSETVIASAHRTPDRVREIVTTSDADVYIAIAGLSAALPGAVASATVRPVIGVPVSGKVNLDSILSIVQMPSGIPVAAVGLDRGDNAALLALQILGLRDQHLASKLVKHRLDMAEAVARDSEEVNNDVQA